MRGMPYRAVLSEIFPIFPYRALVSKVFGANGKILGGNFGSVWCVGCFGRLRSKSWADPW
jgi:hypothetical protein